MSEQVERITGLVLKDLGLSKNDHSLEGSSNMKELKIKLNKLVARLLDHDFNRLLNALYRIDVDEQKLSEVLSDSSGSPAELIADLIIERQRQKILTRIKYRQGK